METNKGKRYPWQREPSPKWQTKEDNSFYHTQIWRSTRKNYLMANPLCENCKKNNMVKAATVVDHILRIKEGGDPLDTTNLQSLCTQCHNAKSAKESHAKR